ncbi:phospholipid/cholesterol/gamma-HCH transport system substrate-binding protein [Marmoricola sp. URHA0025 HA25]
MSQRRQLVVDGTKLTAFLIATALMVAVLVVTTGNIHFGRTVDYHATFRDVSGLAPGDEVRIASVGVGRVESVKVGRSATVRVTFSVDDSMKLTSSTTATVRYKNLVGDRYLELTRGVQAGRAIPPGGSLDSHRTTAALDLDMLLDGFKPLFVGLAPTQINALSGELVEVLQGQQGAVYRLLSTLSSFTGTVATREQVIGRVVDNLNTVLGALDAHGSSVGTIIDQLTLVVSKLSARAPEILDATEQISQMTVDTAEMVRRARQVVAPDVQNLRAVASSLAANSGTLQSVISKWPGHYAIMRRVGAYGNFFNFFLCGVRLRFSPEGATNPVLTPWLSSDTARCQP